MTAVPADPDCFYCGVRLGTSHVGYPGFESRYKLCETCDALLKSKGL